MDNLVDLGEDALDVLDFEEVEIDTGFEFLLLGLDVDVDDLKHDLPTLVHLFDLLSEHLIRLEHIAEVLVIHAL